jgi:cytidine deaminase
MEPQMNAKRRTRRPIPRAAGLVAAARAAARRAHCPYSRFRVGAALVTAGGEVFTGCNVENASYGLTLCADRVALSAAVAAGRRRFRALAVAGGSRKEPAWPCGACRQVLAEFCGDDLPVYVAPLAAGAAVRMKRLGALLPEAFRLRQ